MPLRTPKYKYRVGNQGMAEIRHARRVRRGVSIVLAIAGLVFFYIALAWAVTHGG